MILITSVDNFSRFYSIKSQREFDQKIYSSDYSFVCFAQDDFDGIMIKYMMKDLANRDELFSDYCSILNVLFVYVDKESLGAVNSKYEVSTTPVFLIINRNGEVINCSDLGRHYSVDIMRRFIIDSIGAALRNDADHCSIEAGYDADIENFNPRETLAEVVVVERIPINLLETEVVIPEYRWNRGGGNSRDGRGGLGYHDGKFRLKNKIGRTVKKYND